MMFRTALLSAALVGLLASSSALAASSSCDAITNPTLKKACLAKPPATCNDPSKGGGNSQGGNSQGGNSQGGNSQGGNSQGGNNQGGNSQGDCPVSK